MNLLNRLQLSGEVGMGGGNGGVSVGTGKGEVLEETPWEVSRLHDAFWMRRGDARCNREMGRRLAHESRLLADPPRQGGESSGL